MPRGSGARSPCEKCGIEVASNAKWRHDLKCSRINTQADYSKHLNCDFCSRLFEKPGPRKRHQKYCDLNPNRLWFKGSNQFIKAAEKGLPKPVISNEVRQKLSIATTKNNNIRYADPRVRKKLSDSMKKAVEKYPESYGVSNRGRTKKIEAHGEVFQGKWELYFYEFCLQQNIKAERVTVGFPYMWEGERTYFPDFYLPDLKLYVEVKGYETDRDTAKWKHFPHKLKVIRRAQIEQIKRSEFNFDSFITNL